MANLKRHIFLTGFMGVGKTSTSKVLSRNFGVSERDTDTMIIEKEGCAITKIFEEKGEEYFRNLETSILDDIKKLKPCIISCGGGMVLRKENIMKMKECGRIVLLSATPETIYSHVKNSTSRPLLNGNMNIPYIRKLMEERMPRYIAAADFIIETDGLNPKEVADKIVDTYLKYSPK